MSVTHYATQLRQIRTEARDARDLADPVTRRMSLDRLATRLFGLRLCVAVEGVPWERVEKHAALEEA